MRQYGASVSVEIIGVSGAGKTTLARLLTTALRANGHFTVQTRCLDQIAITTSSRLQGTSRAFLDLVTLGPRLWQGQPDFRRLRRLRRGFHKAISQRMLQSASNGWVIIIEPGWTMQLVGLAMQLERIPTEADILAFLRTSTPDVLVVLDAAPQVAINRMSGRNRGLPKHQGLPKQLRNLDCARLTSRLSCGRETCRRIGQCATICGIQTLTVDVSHVDAAAVAANVANLLAVSSFTAEINPASAVFSP
jgi:hypothetical protein